MVRLARADPPVTAEYFLGEVTDALMLVYDADNAHDRLAYEVLGACLKVIRRGTLHFSDVAHLWETAEKADAARPCNAEA